MSVRLSVFVAGLSSVFVRGSYLNLDEVADLVSQTGSINWDILNPGSLGNPTMGENDGQTQWTNQDWAYPNGGIAATTDIGNNGEDKPFSIQNMNQQMMPQMEDASCLCNDPTAKEPANYHYRVTITDQINVQSSPNNRNYPTLIWNPSKRTQFVSYQNCNGEWNARKLDEHLKMEEEVSLQLKGFPVGCYQVIGYRWVVSVHDSDFRLFTFSTYSGVFDYQSHSNISNYGEFAICESQDNGEPYVVYCQSGTQRETAVYRLPFEYQAQPSLLIEIPHLNNEPSFNTFSPDGRYLVTHTDGGVHLFISNTVSKEVKRRYRIPVEQYFVEGTIIYHASGPVYLNDQYLMVFTQVCLYDSINENEPSDRFSLRALFDLESSEMVGSVVQERGLSALGWVSNDHFLLSDNSKTLLKIADVHSPNTLIDLDIEDCDEIKDWISGNDPSLTLFMDLEKVIDSLDSEEEAEQHPDSLIVCSANQSDRPWLIPDTARVIASFLGSLDLFTLRECTLLLNRAVREVIAERVRGLRESNGRGWPYRFIKCRLQSEYELMRDSICKSNERAWFKLDDKCHRIRGMPDGTDPLYNGQVTVMDKIEMVDSFPNDPIVQWDPSKRAQWITYRNRNDEWIARKLSDDLKMETEIPLYKPKFENQSYRVLSSGYILSTLTDPKSENFHDRSVIKYELYHFSSEKGLGEWIGSVDVSRFIGSAVRESKDDFPIVVYLDSQKERVSSQGFRKRDLPTLLTDVPHSNSRTLFQFTDDGRYLTFFSIFCECEIIVVDLMTGEEIISEVFETEGYLKWDGCVEYAAKLHSNDRYLMVSMLMSENDGSCSWPWDYDLFEIARSGRVLFDLKTGEMVGPLTIGDDICPMGWISPDLFLFGDEYMEALTALSVHCPQFEIPLHLDPSWQLGKPYAPDLRHPVFFKSGELFHDNTHLFILDWEKGAQIEESDVEN